MGQSDPNNVSPRCATAWYSHGATQTQKMWHTLTCNPNNHSVHISEVSDLLGSPRFKHAWNSQKESKKHTFIITGAGKRGPQSREPQQI